MVSGEMTAVEARFSPTGEITPRSFTWQGAHLTVEGVGRRWREGGMRCFTVMALGQTFELRLDEEAFCWRVTRGPASGMVF